MLYFKYMKEDLDKILSFQKEKDWKQFHSPKNLALSLYIQAAEILEIFQWNIIIYFKAGLKVIAKMKEQQWIKN
jgi:hypothetical protein